MNKGIYPPHLFEPIREKIAVSYIQHEARKLFWRLPAKYFEKIDRDIEDLMHSPYMANPRDFWNIFHGIAMGFRLKIGLIYIVTAENIRWTKRNFSVSRLWFGVDLQQTKVVGEGRQPAEKLKKFYFDPKNKEEKEKQLAFTLKLSSDTAPRDTHPIIAVHGYEGKELVYSVHEGNRRLAKAILEGKEKILAYVGEYTTKDKFPKNYWVPTSILMDNLFFARRAYDKGDKRLFEKYMKVLRDMLDKSESAVFEMKNRALTNKQPFRNDVLKALVLSS